MSKDYLTNNATYARYFWDGEKIRGELPKSDFIKCSPELIRKFLEDGGVGEVFLGKDFELQYEILRFDKQSGVNQWTQTGWALYSHYIEGGKRITAIPVSVREEKQDGGEKKPQDFIGMSVRYDKEGQMFFNNEGQLIAELRGWGAIQNLFMKDGMFIEGGKGYDKAQAFQDAVGEFIANAINNSLQIKTGKP